MFYGGVRSLEAASSISSLLKRQGGVLEEKKESAVLGGELLLQTELEPEG